MTGERPILLVEDNELNRDMLIRRLNRTGLEVIWAGDGKQALELMASELPKPWLPRNLPKSLVSDRPQTRVPSCLIAARSPLSLTGFYFTVSYK